MNIQATELTFPAITNTVIANGAVNSVNARDLHGFLEIQSHFTDWIKRRIEDYGFVENQDYIANTQKRVLGFGRGYTDYLISLDMAKELAMVERNHKGRLARRHFIAIEKKAQQQSLNVRQIKGELLRANPTWQKITRYKAMGLNNVEIAKLLGVYKSNVGRTLRRMEQCGIIEPPANLLKMQQQGQRLRLARGVA